MTPNSAAFKLRPLDESSAAEIDLIVARTIDTVLETVPEFGGSQARALALIPSLTHAQMREVYEDPLLLDEKRWRLLAELARALGMLQAKVEKEQEIADLAERINRIEREVRR